MVEMEKDKIVFKGSHPDSLYRVAADNNSEINKFARVLRMLRWPVALISVCIALAVFVYFLMPDNLDARSNAIENGTYWEPVTAAGHHSQSEGRTKGHTKEPDDAQHGTKTSEIDFYDAENDKLTSVFDAITEVTPNRKLPIPPVFPTHLTPEVQYGNEKADTGNLRTAKILDNEFDDNSTVKPHITQRPETPLAIYFKNGSETLTSSTETITRAETFNANDYTNNYHKAHSKKAEGSTKAYTNKENESKGYLVIENREHIKYYREPIDNEEYDEGITTDMEGNFTSGHSKLFGISIEDAGRMKSTTSSSLYNTRVSPTLPTWRDKDDSTTIKYPNNIYSDVQCRSTRLALCRGVLPYDLAGAPAQVGNVEVTSLISQIEFLVATNCSERVRHFVCALLEPECNPPPFPAKLPCYNLCKAIVDNCEGHIPGELSPLFKCKQYSKNNCVDSRTPCYNREFSCSDGSCVPKDWICDGRKDCPAGEDEATCIQCDETEYRCSSGGCILKRWLCDGYADCPGGEDEHESTCGPRHVHADIHEPGEESAGSAPAPAVRRPNRVPTGRKTSDLQRNGENDSSKELLVTSDSSNTYKRNFTRRPLPSRLSQYYHAPARTTNNKDNKDDINVSETRPKKVDKKNMETEKTTQKNNLENESIEDVNMGDLGFFDEFDKESSDQETRGPKAHRAKVAKFGVPPPSAPEVIFPATQATHLDKNVNKFDRVIDGAALLRKAVADQAESVDDQADFNSTYVDKDDGYIESEAVGGASSTNDTNNEPAGSNIPTARSYASLKQTKPSDGEPSPIKSVYRQTQDWSRAHASPCPSGELRCVDGRCITLAQLCDGTIDCSDHADEDNCYT